MTEIHDVAVVGGGPAGCAAALALVRAGHSVALLEKSDYGAPRLGETLPPSVKPLLIELRLWETFLASGPARAPVIQSAWGGSDLYEQNHFFHPHGSGWHVERRRFDAMLARGAAEAGVVLHEDAHVRSCEALPSDGWRLDTSGAGSPVCARFVLDASGRSSAIARRQGARRLLDDHLVGAVGVFAVGAHGPTTLIEAVEDGWWYSAALPDARLVVAFMSDADIHARGELYRARSWIGQLHGTTHTRARVSESVLEYGPVLAAAHTGRLDRMHGAGWLAVGDAALAFDPISGHGIYRALESGLCAVAAVRGWFARGEASLDERTRDATAVFNRFVGLKAEVYRHEARWPGAKFWERRRSQPRERHQHSRAAAR